jgi:uncharacterized protein (TIGR03437 family)
MTFFAKLIAACLLVAGAAGAAPTIKKGGVVNAASYVPPGLPNYGIARGATFVVRGDGLGPEQLQQAELPLPASAGLAGTSVQVTVGGVTVDAILVSTSAKTVSAILPSRTPTGDGSVVVTYDGQKSDPAPILVSQSNFGIFTVNRSGSGPALARNSARDSQPYNTLTESARPGEIVSLYGTGLGPVEFDETAKPKSGDLNVDVEVYAGAQKARVLYKGRSSGSAGVDQIDFIVPESLQGCYVPVVVKAGGAISNFATISVDADGKPCSDPGGLSAADLQRTLSAGAFRYGSISLGRTWTRINAPVPADEKTESAIAGFAQYDAAQLQSPQSQYGLSPGACTLFTFRFDDAQPADTIPPPAQLDAGPVINITGPKGSKQLAKLRGNYWTALSESGAPEYLEAGAYTIDNGEGGADVGAFRTTLKIPEPLVWAEAETIRTVERAQGLTLTWKGGDPDGIISFNGTSATREVGASFTCSERVSAGRFTIPPIVLLSLPSVEGGALAISASTENRFTAPGLDTAYVSFSTATARTVSYR